MRPGAVRAARRAFTSADTIRVVAILTDSEPLSLAEIVAAWLGRWPRYRGLHGNDSVPARVARAVVVLNAAGVIGTAGVGVVLLDTRLTRVLTARRRLLPQLDIYQPRSAAWDRLPALPAEVAELDDVLSQAESPGGTL